MLAFAPDGKYMLLKGRFDWKSLRGYVRGSDGLCNNSFCRMAGSTPDRRISFFPVQSNLMALAVSPAGRCRAPHERHRSAARTRKFPTRPSGFRSRRRS